MGEPGTKKVLVDLVSVFTTDSLRDPAHDLCDNDGDEESEWSVPHERQSVQWEVFGAGGRSGEIHRCGFQIICIGHRFQSFNSFGG